MQLAIILVAIVLNDAILVKKADATREDMGPVIGIDLGTTYSCVGVYMDGRVHIIPNDEGNRVTPSYVAFTAEGERLIGDAAKNQLTTNPENTIFDVKRLIGRTWDDKSVQHDIQFYPFKVIEHNSKPHVQVEVVSGESKTFAPEEISGMVLSKMREIAEVYLRKKITHAVVTVPAYFNDAQRQATKDAGTISGMTVVRIINEPTAAAIAYGLDKKEGEKNILVFDLGGGTFDVTLLTIDNGVFEVLATNGDTHLGGEDFDQRVMDYFIKLYKKKNGKDIRKDNRAVQKLRREVEKAKRALSTAHSTRIEIEGFFEGEDFSETLTRAKFEELNLDLFRSTTKPVQRVLEDSDMRKEQVNEIVLVGGSTRIPKVQQLVRELFDGKEPNTGVNPDEAVAYGAAVHASAHRGDIEPCLVLLISPFTLGIETVGGLLVQMIHRYSFLPNKKSKLFSTAVDNQTAVTIQVYEGQRPLAKHNRFIGKLHLNDIAPAPRGVPQIEVTFEIDVNENLRVTADDKLTGNKASVDLQDFGSRLTMQEAERLANDYEKHAAEDELLRKLLRNIVETDDSFYRIEHRLHHKEAADEFGSECKAAERIIVAKSPEETPEGVFEKLERGHLDEIAKTADDVAAEKRRDEL